MELKKCRLYNYDNSNNNIEYILLNQSQIDLMKYLIKNEHFIYDFEVLDDMSYNTIETGKEGEA